MNILRKGAGGHWPLVLELFLVVNSFVKVSQCFDLFNMTEYYEMPAMYKLDDFDKCLTEYQGNFSVYCLVRTEIRPESNPIKWRIIEKYSKNKHLHFDHDYLERGICIKWCEGLIAGLDNVTRNGLYEAKFNNNSKYTFPSHIVRNTLNYQLYYNELINKCVNYELRKDYNVSGYSQIAYCVSNDDDDSYDFPELMFICVVGILFLVLAFSTAYDNSMKDGKGRDHYKTSLDSTCKMLLVSFSLPRNWYRLTMENPHTLSRELRFIQALRFLAIFLLIYVHSQFIHNAIPVKNPQYVEQYFYFSNAVGLECISYFFTISGFLCGMMFMNMIKEKGGRPNFNYFWLGIVQRYIRLTPVYAFMILLHSTFMYRLGDGPVWDKYIGRERANCRENWWINLLYLNNYLRTNDMCMLQGWYLGAEFHCFILSLFILLLIWRFPKGKICFLGFGITVSFIAVGMFTYFQESEGAILISLQSQQHDITIDDNLQNVYIPTHMNLGGTLFGLSAGILYYHLRERKINVNEYLIFKIFWYLAVPVLVSLIMMSRIFIFNDFEKPAVWIGVYAAFIRHIWPFFFAILYIGCSSNTNVWVANFLKFPLFRPFGRISYSIYLCHLFVTLVTAANLRDPAHFTVTSLSLIWATTLSLSCLLGFLLCITIEFPISAIFKQLTMRKTEKSLPVVRQESYRPNIEVIN